MALPAHGARRDARNRVDGAPAGARRSERADAEGDPEHRHQLRQPSHLVSPGRRGVHASLGLSPEGRRRRRGPYRRMAAARPRSGGRHLHRQTRARMPGDPFGRAARPRARTMSNAISPPASPSKPFSARRRSPSTRGIAFSTSGSGARSAGASPIRPTGSHRRRVSSTRASSASVGVSTWRRWREPISRRGVWSS